MGLPAREVGTVMFLYALSAIPVLAGMLRLEELGGGAEISSENARFVLAPLPVSVHIVSSTIYCLLGAFQFLPSVRKAIPRWHRCSGLLLIPCGLLAAVSGLWMTQFYQGSEFNSTALYLLRWAVGMGMIYAILRGVRALLRREFADHGAWMIRAYALGIAAGTQAFTGLPLLILELGSEASVFLHMAAGWVINLLFAEWYLRNRDSVSSVSVVQSLIDCYEPISGTVQMLGVDVCYHSKRRAGLDSEATVSQRWRIVAWFTAACPWGGDRTSQIILLLSANACPPGA